VEGKLTAEERQTQHMKQSLCNLSIFFKLSDNVIVGLYISYFPIRAKKAISILTAIKFNFRRDITEKSIKVPDEIS
jgi:hypothetical protein